MKAASSPTVEFYASLQFAFDHFNLHLFEGKLPPCLITLRSSSRHFGYHHKDRFINAEGQRLDELGLHPGFFTLRPVEEVLSTLVHEMVHHWQDSLGHPSKSNPHNREWARKMREIGLEPSSTGLPDGKDTGQSVSHYIHPDGAFIRACRQLITDGFNLRWFDRHVPRTSVDFQERRKVLENAGVSVEVSAPAVEKLAKHTSTASLVVYPPPPKSADKLLYLCTLCGIKAWAREGVSLMCGNCSKSMQEGP